MNPFYIADTPILSPHFDSQGFINAFKGNWNSDSILGLERDEILAFVPGFKLQAFVSNTAASAKQ
eukprot:gene5361-7436_t